jgi:hypothetical protein
LLRVIQPPLAMSMTARRKVTEKEITHVRTLDARAAKKPLAVRKPAERGTRSRHQNIFRVPAAARSAPSSLCNAPLWTAALSRRAALQPSPASS